MLTGLFPDLVFATELTPRCRAGIYYEYQAAAPPLEIFLFKADGIIPERGQPDSNPRFRALRTI